MFKHLLLIPLAFIFFGGISRVERQLNGYFTQFIFETAITVAAVTGVGLWLRTMKPAKSHFISGSRIPLLQQIARRLSPSSQKSFGAREKLTTRARQKMPHPSTG